MSNYKPSKYNILLDKKEPYLLFNSVGLSLAKIEKDKIGSIEKLLSCEKIEDVRDHDLFKKLVSSRFIIPAEFDELNYLKLAYYKTKFSTDILELVIFVTKACNFKCSYCFENTDSSEYITNERIARIVKFTEERVKKADALSINWFGGEPLMRFGVIEELTKHFMQLCEKYSCQYAACLTTNGYLLKPKIADQFPKLKIENIQTTLDGPRDIHNQRRMLRGKGETYDAIINNLRYIVKKNIPITINLRCNVDKENLKYVKDWVEKFPEDLKAKVHIHFAITVSGGEEGCPAFSRKDFSIDAEDGGLLLPRLTSVAADAGFVLDFELQRKNVYCNRDKANQFLIGADLSLMACPVGIDKIGYIDENGEANLDLAKHVKWLSKDPFEDDECKGCKLLPLCFGGCNLARAISGVKACNPVKHNLEDWIRLVYKAKII